MGPASDHLTDIDLDCDEAIAAAPLLLPPTIRFGRTTARGAHWLYRSQFPATVKAALRCEYRQAQAKVGGRSALTPLPSTGIGIGCSPTDDRTRVGRTGTPELGAACLCQLEAALDENAA
jgi:hypothetical protein